MLPLAAGVPFLAAPVDLALENWVTGSTGRKAACYTPLPGYQTLLAGLVPALFVVLALGCTVAGLDTGGAPRPGADGPRGRRARRSPTR